MLLDLVFSLWLKTGFVLPWMFWPAGVLMFFCIEIMTWLKEEASCLIYHYLKSYPNQPGPSNFTLAPINMGFSFLFSAIHRSAWLQHVVSNPRTENALQLVPASTKYLIPSESDPTLSPVNHPTRLDDLLFSSAARLYIHDQPSIANSNQKLSSFQRDRRKED
jgi:hypothetical protein